MKKYRSKFNQLLNLARKDRLAINIRRRIAAFAEYDVGRTGKRRTEAFICLSCGNHEPNGFHCSKCGNPYFDAEGWEYLCYEWFKDNEQHSGAQFWHDYMLAVGNNEAPPTVNFPDMRQYRASRRGYRVCAECFEEVKSASTSCRHCGVLRVNAPLPNEDVEYVEIGDRYVPRLVKRKRPATNIKTRARRNSRGYSLLENAAAYRLCTIRYQDASKRSCDVLCGDVILFSGKISDAQRFLGVDTRQPMT